MITHFHHIVPKHMGGSNLPENLVELSVEDHAEVEPLGGKPAHKKPRFRGVSFVY
jgi:hypothetical protein